MWNHLIQSRIALLGCLAGGMVANGAWAAPSAPRFKPNVIYGEDQRKDIYEVADPAWVERARSTVALFKAENVAMDGASGSAKLKLKSYQQQKELCADEPFVDQSTGAFCSGSLVGPDLILTAGHCVRSAADCSKTLFVFGFGFYQKHDSLQTIPAEQVFSCKEIVGRMQADSDWAVIRIDRPVRQYAPLQLNRRGKIEDLAPLTVIGHPAGLPTKVAGGAAVRSNDRAEFFVANLDTYGGNSGSPVFNDKTGLIEGVLVRGEQDYVMDPSGKCQRSNICKDDDCRGEDVTRISEVLKLIPELPSHRSPGQGELR